MKKKIINRKRIKVFSISFFITVAFLVFSMHFFKFLESEPMTWKEIGDGIGGILIASFFSAIICVFKYEDIVGNG